MTTNHIIDDATVLATYIDEKSAAHELTGIVWTTNGTQRVSDVKSVSFDDSRTYEVRLWQVIDNDSANSTLTHEFRWVNGMGVAKPILTKDTTNATSEGSKPKPVSGWFHKVSYLQHESATDSDAGSALETPSAQTGKSKESATTKRMTAIEFVREEDKYGNMVIVDQLSTEEWKCNA